MECQLVNYYTKNGLDRAIDIFEHPNEYKLKHRILAYRYLFQFRHLYYKSPSKVDIENQIIFLYYNLINNNINSNNDSVLLELMDIMLEYTDKGNLLLDNRRIYENKLDTKINPTPTHNYISNNMKTIYSDTQNVHNKSINDSVKKCASILCKKMKTIDKIDNKEWSIILLEFRNIYQHKYDIQLEKIETDPGNFNIGFNIQTIFVALWKYIRRHTYKTELFKRLSNELDAMNGVCLTGYLSRLMNVIQGFTIDEDLQIKISDSEQLDNIIKYHINKILENNDEMFDLLSSTNKDDKNTLYIFILENILDKVNTWKNDYKISDENIYPILNNTIKKYLDINI